MILIAFGSNTSFFGQTPVQIVEGAHAALDRIVKSSNISRLYSSPAWPDPSDPPFVNAVARIETLMPANQLLETLHIIEAAFGRRRTIRNAPRTLDLDLIAYNGLVCDDPGDAGLIVPHPRISARDFVLVPLAEIVPEWCHPITKLTATEMLAELEKCTAEPILSQ